MSRKLLESTIIVTAGSFLGSLFAYLLQVFLGRNLSIEEFGIFTALLSLVTIIGFFNGAVATSLVKLVTTLKAQGKFKTLTQLFMELSYSLALIGIFIFGLIFLSKGFLGSFLNITDTSIFFPFGLYTGISLIVLLPYAYLQGLLRFKAYSFFLFFGSFVRFVFPVIFVLYGYKIGGVFFAMSIGAVLTYLLSLFVLKKNFEKFNKESLSEHYQKMLRFVGPVTLVLIGMTILNNVDVLLVKHYFNSVTAGLYSGVLTIGKVFLFGASTVGLVMFPKISEEYAKKGNVIDTFKPYLYLQLLIVAIGVIVFSMFPEFITKLMFGESYLPSAEYLPGFAIFVGIYILINFMVLYFLAIEKTKIYLFQIPAILLQIILITIYHDDLHQIININIIASSALLIFLLGYFIKYVVISDNSGLQKGRLHSSDT